MARLIRAALWLLMLVRATRVEAQCASANNIGQTQLNPNGGVATAAISDTFWDPQGGSYTFSAQGLNLYVVDNGNMAKTWSIQASTMTIAEFPIPVVLKGNTKPSIFVAGGDAIVRRFDFDPVNGLTPICSSPALVRATCPADTITGAPTVQVWNYSNSAYQTARAALADDLVYVITNHQCSDSSGNTVYALAASTCQPLPFAQWRFFAPSAMDYGSEGCSLDYNSNTLFCGTHCPSTRSQGTVWAIDTTTGTFKWSQAIDSLVTRPQLRNGKLYVAGQSGSLYSLDAGTGAQKWAHPVPVVASPQSITRSPWPEPRIAGGENSVVLVTDTAGALHSVIDSGISGAIAWTYTPSGTGTKVMSAPVVSNIAGKVYVGQNNGELHQLNIVSGANEQWTAAGSSNVTVFDPTLDVRPRTSSDLNTMTVTTSATGSGISNLKTYCIPWPSGAPGTMSPINPGVRPPLPMACPACPASTACVTWACNVTTGNCEPNPVTDGTACDDQKACTCDNPAGGVCPGGADDHCQSGQCVANSTASSCSSTNCVNVGDVGGCATGLYCCGGARCVDLLNDVHNCGACGHDCNQIRFQGGAIQIDKCSNGVCVRDPNKCTILAGNSNVDEQILNQDASKLIGANAINYGASGQLVLNCEPSLSLYNTQPHFGKQPCQFPLIGPGWNNGVALVTPTTVGHWTERHCSFSPSTTPVYPFEGSALDWNGYGTFASFIAGDIINYPTGGKPNTGLYLVNLAYQDVTSPAGLMNPTFNGNLNGWTVSTTNNETVTVVSCSGSSCDAQVGYSGSPVSGDAYLQQVFTIPSDGMTTLQLQWTPVCPSGDTSPQNMQEAYLKDSSGTNTLMTLIPQGCHNSAQQSQNFDVTSLAGQSVMLQFHVHAQAIVFGMLITYPAYLTVGPVGLIGNGIDSNGNNAYDDTQSTAPVIESSASPFGNLSYNQGVVGPIIDPRSAAGFTLPQPNPGDIYFANWPSDGALMHFTANCPLGGSCTFTSNAAANWVNPGGRITAAAFENYYNGNSTPSPMIYMTVGTKIWAYQLDPNQIAANNRTVLIGDANTLYRRDPNNSLEQPVVGFVSAAADPIYGDVYFEALDSAGQYEDLVLYVNNSYFVQGTAQAIYNLADVARSLNQSAQQNGMPIAQPFTFSSEGRLGMSMVTVVRINSVAPDATPTFMNPTTWP